MTARVACAIVRSSRARNRTLHDPSTTVLAGPDGLRFALQHCSFTLPSRANQYSSSVRRVKCDETKPHCKRCTAYGYVCDGYVTPTNPTASHDGRVVRKSSAGSTGSVSGSPDYLDTVLEGRLTAPDNEFMECCQFCTYRRHWVGLPNLGPEANSRHTDLEVLLPVRQRDLDYTNRGPLNLETRYRPGFLLSMTASQIALIAIATKTLPHPSQMTSINHLWSKFHAYMVHNIQDINTYLQGGSPYNRVLALLRITDVLSVELNLLGTSWRAHNSGFLALLNIKDSVGKMLPPSPGLDSARQFHIMFVVPIHVSQPQLTVVELLPWPTRPVQPRTRLRKSTASPWKRLPAFFRKS